MIKHKTGICPDCNDEKEKTLIAGRCQNHYWQYRRSISESKTGTKGKAKINKPIRKMSSKMQERLAIYRPTRDKYLKEHLICEVKGCGKSSTNLHHKKGRIGDLLFDTKYFLACCSTCHPQKIHFTHVKWAIEMGYLLNSKNK